MPSHDEKEETGKLATPQRNNYFYGKLLDEASLRKEQEYFNQKRWLLNRLGLGSGVMCGLQVVNQDDQVCITPGVAIDALGHEIVVPTATLINPRKITDDNGKPTGTEITETGYLCLVYRECLVEPIPVLVTDCEHPNGALPSMIQESYCFLVKDGAPPALPAIPDEAICSALSEQNAEIKRNKICEALRTRGCEINQQTGVVLATFVLNADGKIEIKHCDARPQVYSNPQLFEMLTCLSQGGGTQGPKGDKGDKGEKGDKGDQGDRGEKGDKGDQGPEGRQGIQGIEGPRGKDGPPGQGLDPNLTKIEKINWPHDGTMTWKDFWQMEKLSIQFSNPIKSRPRLNQGWFDVSLEFSGFDWTPALIPPDDYRNIMLLFNQPVLWPEGSVISHKLYIPNLDWLSSNKQMQFRFKSSLVGSLLLPSFLEARKVVKYASNLGIMVRIVVKCDFLSDSNGKCVDGNFLNGVLPTGDMVAGGHFESWFELTEYDEFIKFLKENNNFNEVIQPVSGLMPRESDHLIPHDEDKQEDSALKKFLKDINSIFK